MSRPGEKLGNSWEDRSRVQTEIRGLPVSTISEVLEGRAERLNFMVGHGWLEELKE